MRKVYVNLTGGLGNQLFQLNAGLKIAKGKKVILVSDFSSPRFSISGIPEIENFYMPQNVKVKKAAKTSYVQRKAIGYTLRSSLSPRGLESFRIYKFLVQILTSIISSLHLRDLVRVQTDLDSFPRILTFSPYLVGYFQRATDILEPDNINQMKSLRLNDYNLEKTAHKEKNYQILIIHIRRGDYRQENAFGILGNKYYKDAIRELFELQNFHEVWFFSDEVISVEEFLPSDLKVITKFFAPNEYSAAQSLELMRHGTAYIIANSTLSWWGAVMSYSSEPLVVAPEPWFKAKDIKDSLFFTNWLKRPGFHDA